MAKLSPAQVSKVAQWVAEGASLSAIQGKLSSELGLSMTFLDVRFLVDDLNLTLQEKEEPKKSAEEPVVEEPAAAAAPADGAVTPAPETAPAATSVKVEMDPLARPGTMVSGTVTFSDSQVADWYIDMEGRPGVVPRVPGYRPTQEDILVFQTKLDAALRQAGY